MKDDVLSLLKSKLLELVQILEPSVPEPASTKKKPGRKPKTKPKDTTPKPVEVKPKAKEDDLNKFRINTGIITDSEKSYGTKESLANIKFKNTFKPSKKDVPLQKIDMDMINKMTPSIRNREEFQDKISINCDRCDKKYEAYPYEINIKTEGDEQMDNVCSRCLKSIGH